MATGSSRYWFTTRPSNVVHGYPILVFNARDQIAGRHRHDHELDRLGLGSLRPGAEVGQTRFLARLSEGNGERVGFARIGMAAHLEPPLLPLVPTQQDAVRGRVKHERGASHVQRRRARPRITARAQLTHPLKVALFVRRARVEGLEHRLKTDGRGQMVCLPHG